MRFSMVRVRHDSTITTEVGNVENRSEIFAIQQKGGQSGGTWWA